MDGGMDGWMNGVRGKKANCKETLEKTRGCTIVLLVDFSSCLSSSTTFCYYGNCQKYVLIPVLRVSRMAQGSQRSWKGKK